MSECVVANSRPNPNPRVEVRKTNGQGRNQIGELGILQSWCRCKSPDFDTSETLRQLLRQSDAERAKICILSRF